MSHFNPGRQTLSLGAVVFDKFGHPVQDQLVLRGGLGAAGDTSSASMFLLGLVLGIGGTVVLSKRWRFR